MRTFADQQTVQHRDVVEHDVRARDDKLSGFVILRLSAALDPGDEPDLHEHAQALRLGSLVELLDALGRPPTRRAITSVAPRELLQLEEQAKDGPLPPLQSLTRYWRVDVRRLPQRPAAIAEQLSGLGGVELAYAETVFSDPAIAATTVMNPRNGEQRYLDNAPTGISARWAWTQPGGEGQGVGLADIEQGWHFGHPDLLCPPSTLINITVPVPGHPELPPVRLINRHGMGSYIGHHGTGVVGIIAANDNDVGVIGIAPSLRSLHAAPIFDGTNVVDVANALTGASSAMRRGDVLLLEVQSGDEEDPLPAETDDLVFHAIRLATSLGRTVVEPAGNGNIGLSTWRPNVGSRRLIPGHRTWDSGAIMVGACQTSPANLAEPDGPISLRRTATSNYGKRVNCFAWGERVTTCRVGRPGRSASFYTAEFGGTSSAAAIIAGAAVLTQSMNLARRPGRPLSPGQMRSMLSASANGTQQRPATATKRIGSMPDLRMIKAKLEQIV